MSQLLKKYQLSIAVGLLMFVFVALSPLIDEALQSFNQFGQYLLAAVTLSCLVLRHKLMANMRANRK